MKIILREDVPPLGAKGDTVDVAAGYARNFLIPRNLAFAATPSYLKIYDEEQKQKNVRANKEKRLAQKMAHDLEKISCTATVAVGEEDRIFGSVTAQNIADSLKEQGFDIDKRKIVLEEPLKALGVYTVPIKLHPDVEATVKVWVVKE
ncbi:MAG: 50S ribosomal protein L9 [Gemmatimonadota bacterium]|nr:MAG: 50S ribosomal protein L9 [Gemmatimonadota bacterium]